MSPRNCPWSRQLPCPRSRSSMGAAHVTQWLVTAGVQWPGPLVWICSPCCNRISGHLRPLLPRPPGPPPPQSPPTCRAQGPRTEPGGPAAPRVLGAGRAARGSRSPTCWAMASRGAPVPTRPGPPLLPSLAWVTFFQIISSLLLSQISSLRFFF